MIRGETNGTYPKYLDKNHKIINLGDVLYGEDGKAWTIEQACYGEKVKYPLTGRLHIPIEDLDGCTEVDEFYNPTIKELKPKWLTHDNPNKKIEVKETDIKKWHDDLTCAILELPVGNFPLKTLFNRVRDGIKQYLQDDYEDYI
jgi:hypothetical protein